MAVEDGPTDPVPIFKIDIRKVVTQTVWREDKETEAVVDTAAGFAAIDPPFVKELALEVQPWMGTIVTVSGKQILRREKVKPKISDGVKTVHENVVVMKMGGIKLLLEMNLLRALGTRIRVGVTPEIRLNQDIPLCALGSKPQCTLKEKTKL